MLRMDRDWPFEVKFWGRKAVVKFGFEGGEVKGFTTSGEKTMDDISPSAGDPRLIRLRLKKRARRSEMRTSPPITPPMIASVGFS